MKPNNEDFNTSNDANQAEDDFILQLRSLRPKEENLSIEMTFYNAGLAAGRKLTNQEAPAAVSTTLISTSSKETDGRSSNWFSFIRGAGFGAIAAAIMTLLLLRSDAILPGSNDLPSSSDNIASNNIGTIQSPEPQPTQSNSIPSTNQIAQETTEASPREIASLSEKRSDSPSKSQLLGLLTSGLGISNADLDPIRPRELLGLSDASYQQWTQSERHSQSDDRTSRERAISKNSFASPEKNQHPTLFDLKKANDSRKLNTDSAAGY